MALSPRALFVGVAAVIAVGGAGVSCLPGVDSLEERLNAELVIVGVARGDELEIEIGDTTLTPVVSQAPTLSVRVELSSGTHAGSLLLRRGAVELCTTFSVEVPDDGTRAATVIDLRGSPLCGALPDAGDPVDAGAPVDAGVPVDAGDSADAGEPVDGGEPADAGPPDAGESPPIRVFDQGTHSRETPGSCGPEPCAEVIVVDADGSTSLSQPSGTQQGSASEVAVADVAELVTSTEADALFESGGCVGAPQAPVESVRRRLLVVVDGPVPEQLDQTVVITGCDDPFTSELRAAFARLRDEVFGG